MKPARPVYLALVLAVFCAGCSTASLPVLSPAYTPSRDGGFQYRVPAGWYDATADSQAVGHAVWLLRDDYGATIAVSDLHLDREAREFLKEGGMTRLAALSMTLAAAGNAYTIDRVPAISRINGKPSCEYQLVTSPGSDLLRVVLVDAGNRVYMVTALVPGGSRSAARDDVFAVEEAFLNTLRW